MRIRGLSRGITPNFLALTVALLVIVSINLWLPQAFTAALAIGGLIGAGVVLYEVRLTKRIAQAEFIRLLNDGFVSDMNTNELWRKLLLSEPIGPLDRHRMSAYLTFFETLYVLLGRGVLEFGLVDNLFRNRFFRAIGDPGIQSVALLAHRDSFVNVYSLMTDWRAYLRANNLPLPNGYYSYARARTEVDGFEYSQLTPLDLDDLLSLQSVVETNLPDANILRSNSREMFLECLTEQVVFGARKRGILVVAGIFVDARQDSENIQHHLTKDADIIESSGNLKLILAAPEARGFGVARLIIELLEREALGRGLTQILCTIHPQNRPSQHLFVGLGYRRLKKVRTKYGTRFIYILNLPKQTPTRRTADAWRDDRPVLGSLTTVPMDTTPRVVETSKLVKTEGLT